MPPKLIERTLQGARYRRVLPGRAHVSTRLSRPIPSTLDRRPAGNACRTLARRSTARAESVGVRDNCHHSAASGWQSLPSTAPAKRWRQMGWLRRCSFYRGLLAAGLLFGFLVLAPALAEAQRVNRVVDGDTIIVSGRGTRAADWRRYPRVRGSAAAPGGVLRQGGRRFHEAAGRREARATGVRLGAHRSVRGGHWRTSTCRTARS